MRHVEEAERTGRSIETVSRSEVEDLLYLEAGLIDEWQLTDWVKLYAEDAKYFVPTTDAPYGNPEDDLVYIDHDYFHINELAKRLLSSKAYREYPYSNVRHLVTNVRLLGVKDDSLHVTANFMVWRFRNEDAEPFVGRYDYHLRLVDEELKIGYKKATLSSVTLRPAGAISIVL